MNEEQLAVVLARHAAWLKGEGGERAYLTGADLRGADLTGADLRGADLRGADLRGADLRGADLRGANLRDADLRGAYLAGANLAGANLAGAYLAGADLRDANLRDAYLAGANLAGAYLAGADLAGANLAGANLRDANLAGVMGLRPIEAAKLEIVPRVGCEMIGWKKCRGGVLVRLRVPADARRSNAAGRKCRAERAEVMEVIGADVGVSLHDGTTQYRVGKTVTAHEWCEDRWQECAGGIHFYLTREEAEAHC